MYNCTVCQKNTKKIVLGIKNRLISNNLNQNFIGIQKTKLLLFTFFKYL